MHDLGKEPHDMSNRSFPAEGLPEDQLFDEMEAARGQDVDWRSGKLPGFYVHFATDEVEAVGMRALHDFHSTNALGGGAFPSIVRFETELIEWALDLFHAKDGCGSVTSGGTESIFQAVKTARDWARVNRPDAVKPNMVISHTAHPAFNKAAYYLGIDVVRVKPRADYKTDIDALAGHFDTNTIFTAGSAPQFTHGIFDQIADVAAIAADRRIWFHTDACVGGFYSPFAEELGHDIPPWDFRVPGVRSISADLHKYGFAPKGASVFALADAGDQRYQLFDFSDWSRGRYVTSTFAGTRTGANIAASWAVMRYLGRDGYREIAAKIWDVRQRLIAGLNGIDGIYVVGNPELTLMSYASDTLDINAVASGLVKRGWYTVKPSPDPLAINLGILSLAFGAVADDYLSDLKEVAADVREGKQADEPELVGSYGSR